MWTTPLTNYPDSDIQGLNDPRMIKLYSDVLRDVAKNYGKRKSLRGFMLHELTVTESSDDHQDDLQAFIDFSLKQFGEKYAAKTLPKFDANDVWWRRMMLFRNYVVTDFVRQLRDIAQPLGLETTFCYYPAERWSGEGWRWGFDVLELEKICDRMWYSGYSPEAGKPYQNTRHPWIDFGTSYRGQQLGRNYAYALHGQSTSFFETRIPMYIEAVRKHYEKREVPTHVLAVVLCCLNQLKPVVFVLKSEHESALQEKRQQDTCFA